MSHAATHLPPWSVRSPTTDTPTLNWLTGARFWEQTAFCLRSLQATTPDLVWPVRLVDDGSLDDRARQGLHRAFPGVEIVTPATLETALDARLPRSRFPVLRAHRETYLHLRKLTDPHVLQSGPQLVLDSDQLFHRRPDEVLAWWASPREPLVLTDVADAYGYPREVLATLAGAAVPARVNVGLTGLELQAADWDALEAWTAKLLDRHGSSYFLEQALVALLLAGRPWRQLPADRYRVAPSPDETRAPQAVLHHYVDLTKRDYFRSAWQRVAQHRRRNASPPLPA